MWRAVLLLVAIATGYGQMRSSLTRDGEYYIQTTTGTMPLLAGNRLGVKTTGSIAVRGRAGGEGVGYTVRQKVKAGSELEARRILGGIIVRNMSRSGWNWMTVIGAEPEGVLSELHLSTPKWLKEVALYSQGGNVEAYDIDGDVLGETVGGKVQMDRIGANATAKTGGSEIRMGQVAGIVRCFSGGGSIQVDSAGGEAWCETAGGEITINEARGPLHCVTAGGNIRVNQAYGVINARSDGGLIEIQKAAGIVTAQTRGGSIQIGAAAGVQCESAQGAIRVRSVSGAIRAQTALGSILAELSPGARVEDSSLTTMSGDITVFIPSNLAVTVEAVNETMGRPARIVSDFTEIRARTDKARPRPIIAEGSLNGGGPVLRILVASGTIYLRRQK